MNTHKKRTVRLLLCLTLMLVIASVFAGTCFAEGDVPALNASGVLNRALSVDPTGKAEGFSTAATEALIVGTPVITTEVSGMREMLGNDEYGVITANDEEALYLGIKRLLEDPELLAHYREKAVERGRDFSMENTVKAVEDLLLTLQGRGKDGH